MFEPDAVGWGGVSGLERELGIASSVDRLKILATEGDVSIPAPVVKNEGPRLRTFEVGRVSFFQVRERREEGEKRE